MITEKKDTKEKIIEAVYSLVQKHGIARMTMETVAEKAGISKSGLFYHFPTKELLIEAMMSRLFNQFDHQLTQEYEDDQNPGGRTRSYIKTTFLMHDQEENEFVVALLAALVNNPELLKPARDYYKLWQTQLENDQIDPVISTIIRLTTDGLWFSELFGLAPIDTDLRQKVYETLSQLISKQNQ